MNAAPASIVVSEPIDSTQVIRNALSLLGKEKRNVREMRQLIIGLEEVMKTLPSYVPGEDFKTTHHFHPGIYMREALIPKGFVVTGKIHKTSHLNILSQGTITVWTEDGMKTLTASSVIKSEAGIKRAGYAHEDCIWITVHSNPTDERDIKKVEARLFADTFDEAYLGSDRSFEDAILFLGFTQDEMKAMSENESDQVRVTMGGVRLGDSKIHGLGIFSLIKFSRGTLIAHARVNNMRTQVGRYCNHSASPNVEIVMRENGDLDAIALRDIDSGEELFCDYYLFYNKKGSELCQL